MYTLMDRGGKPDRKPYSLPYGSRNPYRNLKFENSPGFAQNAQQNYIFMNSASDLLILSCPWDQVVPDLLFLSCPYHQDRMASSAWVTPEIRPVNRESIERRQFSN
jgi:hypothetical protein